MRSRLRLFLFYIVILLLLPVHSEARIYINEILASNNTINYDPNFYNFSDWIEIYNDDSYPVNLNGYTISDDINIPDKYLINFTLIVNPRGYCVLWADGENWYPNTNFSLDSDGEFVALFDPDGVLVDSFSFGAQLPDVSYGRYPDGSSEFYYLPRPSCLGPNCPGVADMSQVSDSVIFSQGGGFYSGSQIVELSTLSPTATIRYTTDGSSPNSESDIYHSALSFSKTTVIRAKSFDDSYLPSSVQTETYFINQESNLPVLSISTKLSNFTSYTYGIYAEGSNGIEGNCADSAVNYNQPWERTINFEYFAPDGECKVNQVVGIKIAGRCSRTKIMKPLGIYSRKKYGKEGIDGYQFFNSKNLSSPKDLLLRNSGTESYSTYLRDGFMQTLIMDRMDMDYQAYQPLALYINGKYWGIYNLREKMNEHYVESNYGIDPESIDLLEYNTLKSKERIYAGDKVLYNEFLEFVTSHDLSIPENYEYVKSQMDVDEFMNIHIANIYFENEDWPNNNNKYWRKRAPGGKWRWYMFDLDFGFGYEAKTGNTVKWVFGGSPDSEIASNIKSNAAFKNEFVQRMASHLNTSFQTERVLTILDSLKGNIDQEMYRHVERWGNPWSHEKWEQNMEVLLDFARGRAATIVPQIMEEFDLSGTYNLNVENAQPALGELQIAGVDIPDGFNGFYFTGIPLRIHAIPKPGYQFSGWSGDISSSEEETFISSDSDLSVIANFSPDEPIENLYINEFLASNTEGIVDDSEKNEDWIEIYNHNDYPVDLGGFYISDSLGSITQSQIPFGDSESTIVPAKGYKLLWADKDPEQGSLHLSCKLRKSGEMIILSQQIGSEIQIIDSLSYTQQYSNVTYGRDPFEPDQWKFLEPTPEAENVERRLENISINEFMASNRSVIRDEDGNWDDWIEIYNANDYPVDIAGMFISDDFKKPSKFRISDTLSSSTTIPANGYILLWADDSTEQGVLHLNFGLSGSGEQILIVQPGGFEIIDSITYPDLIGDAPYGRTTDGSGSFSYLLATPGASNVQPSFESLCINELMASNQRVLEDREGEFDDWIELYNTGDTSLNVGGLFLSDDMADRTMYRISTAYPDSTTIPAKGHLLIWADDSTEQGILHAGFGIGRSGEKIILSSSTAKTIIDSLSFGMQVPDISLGRTSDGALDFAKQMPTPGAANKTFSYDGIILSEVMASDHEGMVDEYGEYEDWLELYNSSDSAIDIAGMVLSDSLGQVDKYFIPGGNPELSTIEPDHYLIIWADGSPDQGTLHVGFGLSESGEQVGIYTTDGQVIDSISYPNQYDNFSYSKLDQDQWMPMPPTPGSRNWVEKLENIYINEYMSDNENRLMDEFGEYDDWIEIYNNNSFPVNLAGLYLSDSLAKPGMYRIPSNDLENTRVPEKGYLIIWADSDSEQGSLHTNFKLSKSGEDLVLSSYDYRERMDSWSYDDQYSNFSTGRLNDEGPWLDIPPTPGEINIMPDLSHLFINEILTANVGINTDSYGEFDDWIELYNEGPEAIDLGGLFLTDSIGDSKPFRISSDQPDSTTIQSGEFVLIWADDSTGQGVFHADFKLSRSGEQLGLYGYDGKTLVDSVTYEVVPRNITYGRYSDGYLPWTMLGLPTPRQTNRITAINEVQMDIVGSGFEIYPNPAVDKVIISMEINTPAEVVVKIYDQTGSLIAVPVKGFFASGHHDLSWDLVNENASPLGTGVYFYVIETEKMRIPGKLIVVNNH